MDSIVINLFGGPCIGKSTIAAGLYYELKNRGIDCELASEVAKEQIWDNNPESLNNQPYIFGKQVHKIWTLYGKVKIIICDSPILLCAIYSKEDSKLFNQFILEEHLKYRSINYMIHRNDYDNFDEKGRVHNKVESIEKDKEINDMLDNYHIPYKLLYGDGSKEIVEQILNEVLTVIK